MNSILERYARPDFSNVTDSALLEYEKEWWVEHASDTDGPGRLGAIAWAWRVQECFKRGLQLQKAEPPREWLDWASNYKVGD